MLLFLLYCIWLLIDFIDFLPLSDHNYVLSFNVGVSHVCARQALCTARFQSTIATIVLKFE